MRPTTSSMGRPVGTSSGTGPFKPPPSSRMRSALTSSSGTQAATQGGALSTEVLVSDRPVTQQGMRGMKTGQGPTRQVQDASYYIGVLRAKVTELTTEIASLSNELNEHQRGHAQSSQLSRRQEALLQEVRQLEGTLADYNLAMDKHRTGTDPAELLDYINEFEKKNFDLSQEIDRIYMLKKSQDQQTSQVEGQIQALHTEAQRKLNELNPRKLEQYNGLMQRSEELQNTASQYHQHLDALNAHIRQHEQEAGGGRPSLNEEYSKMMKKRNRLEKEEENLAEEMRIANLDPKEAQQTLLARVKMMNARVQELDGTQKKLKEEKQGLEKQLQELSNELAERKGESGEKDKYEKLHQRDQEMTSFIAEFEATRAQTVADQSQTQDTVVALLEHISTGLGEEDAMPSQQRLKEMKEEASFKERALESSQQTMQRLQGERKQRLAEMEKIQNLDEKIQVELASLEQKMGSMRGEMTEFEDLEGLRRRAAATLAYLNRLLKQYHARRESVKQQVTQLTSKYDGIKKQLASSDTSKTLTQLELKLRSYAQTIFQLNEFVETKGRESDFEAIKENCTQITSKLNDAAKERCMAIKGVGGGPGY